MAHRTTKLYNTEQLTEGCSGCILAKRSRRMKGLQCLDPLDCVILVEANKFL